MATLAGNANYAIAIATAIAGAAGSETPSGDIVYLYAKKANITNKNKDKRNTIAANGAIKIVTAKNDLGVKLTDCTVSKEVTAESTLETDVITNFIYDHGRKIGSTKVYMFVYNIADGRYVKLSHVSGTHVRYMYGLFGDYDIELGQGGLFKIKSLIFEQVTV